MELRRLIPCLALLTGFGGFSVCARTADEDAGAAARHGISQVRPIVLHDVVTVVSRFIEDKYEAAIVTACAPEGGRIYAVTHPVETMFATIHPDGTTEPYVVQEVIPIHDVLSGMSLNTIETHEEQKLAFTRVRFADKDKDEVILVTAARVAEAPRTDSQVQFQIYRYHSRPIPDGAIETFEPAISWQSSATYRTASAAMETAFGIMLPEDEDRLCARNVIGGRPRP